MPYNNDRLARCPLCGRYPEVTDAEGDDVYDSDEGRCGSCRNCEGVDETTDTCFCRIGDPHADWRYKNNEKCPNWKEDRWPWSI